MGYGQLLLGNRAAGKVEGIEGLISGVERVFGFGSGSGGGGGGWWLCMYGGGDVVCYAEVEVSFVWGPFDG